MTYLIKYHTHAIKDMFDCPYPLWYSNLKAVNIMAKKHKHYPNPPLAQSVPFTEKERLEYMINLNENSISPNDYECDSILREQIENIKSRIKQLEKETLKA